jgi:predicted PurR-regulated permease PerM
MSRVTPTLPPRERLRRAGTAAWALVGVSILAGAAIWSLYEIRVIWPPLVLALLIVYILNPIVTRLERRGIRRAIGAILVYVAALALVVLLAIALTPFFSHQIQSISDDWPTFRVKAANSIHDTAQDVSDALGLDADTGQIYCLFGVDDTTEPAAPSTERCDAFSRRLREGISDQTDRIGAIGFSVLETGLIFIIAPLLALYLLIDLPKIQRDILHLVPPSHREEVADLAGKAGRILGGFFRGQLLLAFVVGVMCAIGFWAIGLQLWLVVAIIVGIFNLIPVFGGLLAAVFSFAVGALVGEPRVGLLAALVVFIVQQIHNHLLHPFVMKAAVNLHPVTVMMTILAGGALAGFWGILLSVPAVAVSKLFLAHFWETRVLGAEITPYGPPAARAAPTDGG